MIDAKDTRSIMSSVNKAKKFMKDLTDNKQYSVISLGQNCNTAWYLKQVGARTEAYPFDWIFSSAEIAESCLRDGFSTFLNRHYIIRQKNGQAAGHSVYHANMFHHRSPLQSEEDYDYYVRCVDRFKRKLSSLDRILFVCTIISEPEKRPAWSAGFCYECTLPTAQSYHTYKSFMEYAGEINQNIKYIFIEQYTEGILFLNSKMVAAEILSLSFTSRGRNDGLRYLDDFDDSIAKLLYSGMVA